MPNGDDKIETLEQQEKSQGILLQFDALPKINFALTRNGTSIIKSIVVNNPTDIALTDIRISLRSIPKFLHMRPLIIENMETRVKNIETMMMTMRAYKMMITKKLLIVKTYKMK